MLPLVLKSLLTAGLAVSVHCKQRCNKAPQDHWDDFPGAFRAVKGFFGSLRAH